MRRNLILPILAALFLTCCGQMDRPTVSPTPPQTAAVSSRATPALSGAHALAGTPAPTGAFTPQPAMQTFSTTVPIRTPTRTTSPTPTLPDSAEIKGMYGYGQLLPLTCEARSAADWARHFGVKIRELEFMARLPKSPNPEEGFVGSPKGGWGQIPPDAYGVHAGPVARVLREYGINALARHSMSFQDLRAELASGRPVIVWVTGHVAPGKSVAYRLDGKTITVARYEHTVIATGYDSKNMTFLDGKTVYKRPIETFLQSWQALDNMAIIWVEKPGIR